jgi:hypothetical protein
VEVLGQRRTGGLAFGDLTAQRDRANATA